MERVDIIVPANGANSKFVSLGRAVHDARLIFRDLSEKPFKVIYF